MAAAASRLLALAALLSGGALSVSAKQPSPNMPCLPMEDYMPKAASESYNMSKHNGTWYEVSFRDLYPWGPMCECQQVRAEAERPCLA